MKKKSHPVSVRLLVETHFKLKELFPALNRPSSIDQAVLELHGIRNNKDLITLNLDENLLSDLKELALKNRQTVENFIIDHICLELRGHAIYCPKCQRPQFLEWEIESDQAVTIKCVHCGHEWKRKKEFD